MTAAFQVCLLECNHVTWNMSTVVGELHYVSADGLKHQGISSSKVSTIPQVCLQEFLVINGLTSLLSVKLTLMFQVKVK